MIINAIYIDHGKYFHIFQCRPKNKSIHYTFTTLKIFEHFCGAPLQCNSVPEQFSSSEGRAEFILGGSIA